MIRVSVAPSERMVASYAAIFYYYRDYVVHLFKMGSIKRTFGVACLAFLVSSLALNLMLLNCVPLIILYIALDKGFDEQRLAYPGV